MPLGGENTNTVIAAHRGYYGAEMLRNVQQIADEAGIGKGTVYEYFASKDEILQGMALYCFDTCLLYTSRCV